MLILASRKRRWRRRRVHWKAVYSERKWWEIKKVAVCAFPKRKKCGNIFWSDSQITNFLSAAVALAPLFRLKEKVCFGREREKFEFWVWLGDRPASPNNGSSSSTLRLPRIKTKESRAREQASQQATKEIHIFNLTERHDTPTPTTPKQWIV